MTVALAGHREVHGSFKDAEMSGRLLSALFQRFTGGGHGTVIPSPQLAWTEPSHANDVRHQKTGSPAPTWAVARCTAFWAM